MKMMNKKDVIVALALALLLSCVTIVACEKAPDKYSVTFTTTVHQNTGTFTVDVRRKTAPLAADHFYSLVQNHYYDNNGFFAVMPEYVQFGINGDPDISAKFFETIADEPRVMDNSEGTLVFVSSRDNDRATQILINLQDNAQLDAQDYVPFGVVSKGMEIVRAISSEYRNLPEQDLIYNRGNVYLQNRFPDLDYILTARIVGKEPPPSTPPPPPSSGGLSTGMVLLISFLAGGGGLVFCTVIVVGGGVFFLLRRAAFLERLRNNNHVSELELEEGIADAHDGHLQS